MGWPFGENNDLGNFIDNARDTFSPLGHGGLGLIGQGTSSVLSIFGGGKKGRGLPTPADTSWKEMNATTPNGIRAPLMSDFENNRTFESWYGNSGIGALEKVAHQGGPGQNKSLTDSITKEGDQEAHARLKILNDTLKENIDNTTKNELGQMYQKGASSIALSNLLNDARAGKGIFGVRKVDVSQEQIRQDQPGREQTVLSAGKRTVLGAG